MKTGEWLLMYWCDCEVNDLWCVWDGGASPRLSELYFSALITVQSTGSVYGSLSVSVQTDIGSGKVLEPGRANIIVTRSGQTITAVLSKNAVSAILTDNEFLTPIDHR